MPLPLFVSDLDGTLLQPDGTLSRFALETLADLTARGVPFTVASGRDFSSIRRALGTARLNLPVISSDGALISTFDSPKPLHVFAMDTFPLEELVDDLQERGFAPVLDIWDGNENFHLSEGPQNPIMTWYHDVRSEHELYRWRHEPRLRSLRGAQTISVTVLDRPEWLEPLREDIDEKYGEWFKTDSMLLKGVEDGAALWIQHRDARKEAALEVLSQMLGFDDVVIFGDELNDLGMFEGNWRGVAVENARTEVKQAAKEVIGHHADDAVLKYILKWCS